MRAYICSSPHSRQAVLINTIKLVALYPRVLHTVKLVIKRIHLNRVNSKLKRNSMATFNRLINIRSLNDEKMGVAFQQMEDKVHLNAVQTSDSNYSSDLVCDPSKGLFSKLTYDRWTKVFNFSRRRLQGPAWECWA